MDLHLIFRILIYSTLILVVSGLVLILYLTHKYEKLSRDDPDRRNEYETRRKIILRTYLRIVLIVFSAAVILRYVD